MEKYQGVESDPAAALSICQTKLKELQPLVAEFVSRPLTTVHKRLYVKLTHVESRLAAIDANEELISTHQQLVKTCNELLDLIDDAGDTETMSHNDVASYVENLTGGSQSSPVNINRTSVHEDEPGAVLSTRLQQVRFSQCDVSNIAVPQSPTHRPTIPVLKWNLKFSGDTTTMGVNAFLEQVGELQVARNVSEDQLLSSAIDLFEGHALVWYRSIRHKVSSWIELSRLLREVFLPSDFDDELWDEIKNRRQGQDEKTGIFVAVMINLFQRLSHVPAESVQLKFVIKNLQPYYASHLALVTVINLDHLITLCRKLEETKSRNTKFRQSTVSSAGTSPLEPDLAYHDKQSPTKRAINTVTPSASVERPSTSQSTVSRLVRFTPNRRCWNCRLPGHTYHRCTAERTLFCFVCGTPEVVYQTCPQCSNRKNGLGRSSTPAGEDPAWKC